MSAEIGSRAGADVLDAGGPRAVRRRRRIRWVVVGVAVLAVLGTGTGVVLTRLAAQPATAAPQAPPAAETVEVVRTDLAERRSVTGNLGYGAEHTLSGRRPGTITALPAQGAVLDRGATVYQVDAKPVVLFTGDIPLYRDVGPGVTDGPDVQVVEENLRALGFGGFGAPDTRFTDATAAAIKKWQKSLGLEQTGVIGMGEVIITAGPVRVAAVSAELGGSGAGALLTYTATTRAVTVEVSASQKDFAKPGAKVTLSVGSATVAGTIATLVPNAPSNDNNDPRSQDQEQTFTATITPDDQAALGEQDAGSVDVRFTTGSRQGVLVVPVGALLALAEGGYAVEVVDGAQRRLVGVRTGLFADGKVEISGDGLAEGMRVVTTS
jgi:peptidoglycan hydrolase-like protein with peptidoglycan-binding domain